MSVLYVNGPGLGQPQMSLQGVTGSWWAEARVPGSSLNLQGYNSRNRQAQPQRDEETHVPFVLLSVPLPSFLTLPGPLLWDPPLLPLWQLIFYSCSPPAFARRAFTDTSSGVPSAQLPRFWKLVWGSHEVLLGSHYSVS